MIPNGVSLATRVIAVIDDQYTARLWARCDNGLDLALDGPEFREVYIRRFCGWPLVELANQLLCFGDSR